jgi:hypothetical protein
MTFKIFLYQFYIQIIVQFISDLVQSLEWLCKEGAKDSDEVRDPHRGRLSVHPDHCVVTCVGLQAETCGDGVRDVLGEGK